MKGWLRPLVFAIVCTAVVGVTREAIGQPLQLPGTIQVEDFDQGAEGVAFFDMTPGNSGGAYRSTNVDIEPTNDTGGGFNLAWVAAGEWLKYTVTVTSAGSYELEVRVAARGAGGIFHIEIDGVDRTGPIAIPETGGWQQWTSIRKPGLNLNAGSQVWRLVMDQAGEFAVGNINFLRVISTAPSPKPAPLSVPTPAPSATPTPQSTGDQAASEIVLYASDITTTVGNWIRANHQTGAGGQTMQSNDAGWSSANEALPAPADYFEARFTPASNRSYRVWMRLRASADSKFNDSVWLQFSGAVDTDGAPLWRIGTTSALLINLETCPNCGVSGWGWQTAAWWVPQDSIVRFNPPTEQTLRVQTREDGVRVDQIVLSSATYIDSPPGAPINDTVIVPKTRTATASPTNPAPATPSGPRPAGPPPPRPTTLAFTASRDHDAKVTSYSVAIYRVEDSPTAKPVDNADLGKPAPSNGEITVDISGMVNSLPSGWYYVIVNAHYPAGVVASAPTTPFPK